MAADLEAVIEEEVSVEGAEDSIEDLLNKLYQLQLTLRLWKD